MGQVYSRSSAVVGTGAGSEATGAGAMYFEGSATNFSRHPALQKYQVWPACSARCRAEAGSTFIPHTGSVTTWVFGAGSWWVWFMGSPVTYGWGVSYPLPGASADSWRLCKTGIFPLAVLPGRAALR